MEVFMKYEEFRNEQIRLQLAWREKQEISKEYGSQNGKTRAWIVPKTEWKKTIWIQLEKSLMDYLIKENVQHHTGVHNLLSSWVLCSNLYFGIYINYEFKELFRQFLEKKLGIFIEAINKVYLEFAMNDDLSPANLLGEPDGKRGSGQTSPDVAVSFKSEGENILLLIECKYTEHSFYNCSGRKRKTNSRLVPNPKPERCLAKETIMNFEDNCHQILWGRKYWEFLKISEYGINNLIKCPASIGGYQLIRQQALTEGILNSGKFNKVFSCVAYDGRNEALMASMKLTGINSIKDEWKKLYNIKSDFIIWEHQEWVEYVKKNCKEQFEKDWIKYMNERYDM
jgi:hypothetical protein